MKPPHSPGFSTPAALVTAKVAQRLGLERGDRQLAGAGVALEQRARLALHAGQAMLAPVKPPAAPQLPPLQQPADPDEVWGGAGIAALQALKAEKAG